MQFLLNTEYKTHNARYYDSDISIWLSVDPLSDKYPHQSNYMYCSGRPIIMIDPDGRDEFNVCSQTGKITKNNDNKHYIDENGGRIVVEAGEKYEGDKDLSKMKEVDVLFNDKEQSINVTAGVLGSKQSHENEFQSFSFGSHKEAENLYYFWAESTMAEIAMCLTTYGSGHVGTNYKSSNTAMTAYYEKIFGSSISLMSHSHSIGGAPSYDVRDSNNNLVGDLEKAYNSKYKYKHQVYDVPNKIIYEYSKNTYLRVNPLHKFSNSKPPVYDKVFKKQ